ncbi:MAG: hypothetical protein COS89_01195 [Deltaproteobacteria bacterium CG07_land_8_20_14_0_80_38_7]|nr:MAG: hypothetical protein COS89_01195 [Deltaproteobacteria bacterium CG07_land_8_20_14_0_80_38_7]
MNKTNIVSLFFENAEKNCQSCCFHSKEQGLWKTYTWKEIANSVEKLAQILLSFGVQQGDRIAIISTTRREWTIADLAILACGAVTVPVYPTYPLHRIQYILEDANVRCVFVETDVEKEKVQEAIKENKAKTIIIQITDTDNKDVFSFSNLLIEPLAERFNIPDYLSKIDSESIATIVYTSGTTGQPKGAVLTHKNIFTEVMATGQLFTFDKDEVGLLALPLSHVLGRLIQFHHLSQGYQLAFIEAFDKFAENCRDVQPHFIVGVPRILEKMYERIAARVDNMNPLGRIIFQWAHRVGVERSLLIEQKCCVNLSIKIKYFFADLFIFRKIRGILGGRLNLFISGGASLAEDIVRFFHAMGLLVLEGYGLTETFAAATVNRYDNFRFGTVGKPLSCVEIKLDADNEILINSPTVFQEYLNKPEETLNVKTNDGWLRTGDIGVLSEDGFLSITDRKKEIIVTSGGQNIAPQMIESAIMESRYINYCMVYGDQKKYLTVLVTLNPVSIVEYARKNSIEGLFENIVLNPKIKALIQDVINEKNKKFARHETIKKFIILDRDFLQTQDELTPTLKIRRKIICEKFKDRLDQLYKE